MNRQISQCPCCGKSLIIREYECPECSITVRGEFDASEGSATLTASQMELIKIFVRTYGNIGELAKELSVSRPTAKQRISQLGKALGLSMPQDEKQGAESVLEALDRGDMTFEEALEKIKT